MEVPQNHESEKQEPLELINCQSGKSSSMSHLVTRLTTLGYTESCRPIVTGSTGFALLHVFHGRLIRATLSLEQVGMAIVAAKHACVNGVREGDVTSVFFLEENVAGMTRDAVTSYAERSIPIVATAAGFAAFHFFHAGVVAVVLLFENFRMTRITFGAMYFMTEYNFTDGLGLYVDFVHHYTPIVARPTILRYTES